MIKFFIVLFVKNLVGCLSIFLTAFSIGSAIDSTIPNLITPEQIEFAAAYCLFSFSVSGVKKIDIGRTVKERARDVLAEKEVPWSEIFSRDLRTVLFFNNLVEKFDIDCPIF